MTDAFFKETFGMNVRIPSRVLEQIKQTAEGSVFEMWEPLFEFVNENQNVFTGNVANQIEKYELLMFNIGSELRKGSTNGDFNVTG